MSQQNSHLSKLSAQSFSPTNWCLLGSVWLIINVCQVWSEGERERWKITMYIYQFYFFFKVNIICPCTSSHWVFLYSASDEVAVLLPGSSLWEFHLHCLCLYPFISSCLWIVHRGMSSRGFSWALSSLH